MFISEDSGMVDFGWKYLSRQILIQQTFVDLSGDHVCLKCARHFFQKFQTCCSQKSLSEPKKQKSHTLLTAYYRQQPRVSSGLNNVHVDGEWKSHGKLSSRSRRVRTSPQCVQRRWTRYFSVRFGCMYELVIRRKIERVVE